MSDQEIYDHTLDTPAPPASSVSPVPAPTLPNEPYYQQPAPHHRSRNASLGIALVLVGLMLLAFQVLGHGLSFDGGDTIPLVNQQLAGNRLELSAAASDVEVSTSGDTVRVVESSRNFFCLFCSRHVSYRISVPNRAQADIKTASGDITVEGLKGAVALSTVSGEIRANDLEGGLTAGTTSGEVQLNNVLGKLQVNTISGDVRLEDGKVDSATVNTTSGEVDLDGVAGALNIGTVSGDVAVRDAHDGQLTVSTTSGSFEYSGDLAHGESNAVNSISGDVKFELPSESSMRLDASTISGSINSDFDLTNREEGLRSLKGVAGDGATSLTVGTTSGDISIEKR